MANVQSFHEGVADTAQGEIQSVISGLEASLADLGGFVNAVKSSWDGDEMEQYAQIQRTWDASAAEVKTILAAVEKGLGTKTSSVKTMRGRVAGALTSAS